MRACGWRSAVLVACVCAMWSGPVLAEAKLGEPIGKINVIDERNKPLEIPTAPDKERTATALVFLSARSEAVRETLPYINELYRKHRRLGVAYVGVCPNAAETPDELREFGQNRGMIFTIYRDPEAALAKQLGISHVPSVALVDRTGRLLHRGDLASEEGLLALDAAVTAATAKREAPRRGVAPTPISEIGEAQPAENLYGTLSFSSELIFEEIPDAAVFHCSTITEAPNGDLLCLWYGGSYESADDQSLFLARRAKGERVWQKPEVLLRGPDPLPGNGVIFVDGHETVWIVWCRMESARPIRRGGGWNNCRLMYRLSTDNGHSWSDDAEFLQANLKGVPRNPPLRTSKGDLVLPVEGEADGEEGSVFLLGADGGRDWSAGGFTAGGSQPAVIERKDGSLFALMRKAPRLTQIESKDGGKTWSEATSSTLRNPNAGISMTKLASGSAVVVFNDSDRMRTPLSIARSIDEGKTWETPLNLESNPGEYSYPCVIQTSDGKIHVTYTYRRYSIMHVEFNEDWLVRSERPN